MLEGAMPLPVETEEDKTKDTQAGEILFIPHERLSTRNEHVHNPQNGTSGTG
jgi:hypothetical protein